MSSCSSPDTNHQVLLTHLLYDNLLSFILLLYHHPLHFAYLVYFSHYIFLTLSFLFPLLLSTSIILLLLSLHSILEAEVEAEVNSSSLPLVAALVANVLEWEFDSRMSELYENVGLVRAENSDKSELLVSDHVGIGDQLNRQIRMDDERVYEVSSLGCGIIEEDPVELSVDQRTKTEMLESNSKGFSFVPQTPDRTSEVKLNNSPSIRTRDLEGGRAAIEGFHRDGSVRKQKEWKRTLACKLYEERMSSKLLCEEEKPMVVVDGAEEMDLLWEAYEADGNKSNKLKNKSKSGKKKVYIEDGDGDESVGQLCCLNALSFSTAKMSLAVGKTNLARISKVFKGNGLLRRSSV